jgi:phenylalanyl-tRNA synthetase alpha chain
MIMSIQLIDAESYRRSLAVRDLTDAALGPHAMQLLVRDAIAALRDRWRCAVVVHRAPPVVRITANYDELGYPPDGAARDARYTRYVTTERLLRSQTSAMIPAALRMIAPAAYDDVLLACPGLAYRRDAIDRLHVGEPEQLDLWRLARRPLARPELEEMIVAVAHALLPGAELRLDPAEHPYTLDGIEVHARVDGRWVEILECGLAHPRILEAGLGAGYTGLAMGVGLDRMLMLRKRIDDIRVLRSTDPRIAAQMLDLAPYRPVSYGRRSSAIVDRSPRRRRPRRSATACGARSAARNEHRVDRGARGNAVLGAPPAARERRDRAGPEERATQARDQGPRAHAHVGRSESAARRGLRRAARGHGALVGGALSGNNRARSYGAMTFTT